MNSSLSSSSLNSECLAFFHTGCCFYRIATLFSPSLSPHCVDEHGFALLKVVPRSSSDLSSLLWSMNASPFLRFCLLPLSTSSLSICCGRYSSLIHHSYSPRYHTPSMQSRFARLSHFPAKLFLIRCRWTNYRYPFSSPAAGIFVECRGSVRPKSKS